MVIAGKLGQAIYVAINVSITRAHICCSSCVAECKQKMSLFRLVWEKFISITRTNQTQSSSWSPQGGSVIKCFCWSYLKTLLQHIPPFAPFSLRIISSIKSSSPLFCVLCVLYCISSIAHVFVVCKERTWKWENVKRRKCLAQQKAKHMTPKRSEKKTQNPSWKKKIKLKCTRRYWIQFNSIRFVSVVLLQLPRRVPFVRLGTTDKVYLTERKSANNCEIY